MKYVLVLPDGVADRPIEELGGRTPLQVAQHPNMDWIAAHGITGLAKTIPDGLPPGSDVGCMSVFGFDPRTYYTGRAPLEAAAQGIHLGDSDVVFRCNTVTTEGGILADYSAGHIESADSAELIHALDKRLGRDGVRFHPGVSYRHLAVVASGEWGVASGELAKTTCTPPHDISGRPIAPHWPRGAGAERLTSIMKESVGILKDHPVNTRRAREGKRPATMVWFWGQGTRARLPSFRETFGLSGGCISAVDIVRGLGTLVGLDIVKVPGITGYFDTNYRGKAEYALKALEDRDFMLVHIESTDEAGHMGDVQKKIEAIEATDRLVVGTLLGGLKQRGEPYAIMVVPDHPTSTAIKTHIAEPVPFAIYATGGPKDAVATYDEVAVQRSEKRFEEGHQLMPFFLQQGRSETSQVLR